MIVASGNRRRRKEGRMGKTRGILVGLLVLGALRAQESLKAPRAAPSQDIWEAAYLDNGRAGHFVTSFQEMEEGGKKLVRARQSLNLSIRRSGSVLQVRMQSGTHA